MTHNIDAKIAELDLLDDSKGFKSTIYCQFGLRSKDNIFVSRGVMRTDTPDTI